MTMRVFVATPPAEPLISLAEAKEHLRVRHAVEDALIEGMVAAAVQSLDGPDGNFGRALGMQVLEARFGCTDFECGVALPYPPIVELLSVSYLDSAGQLRSADLADFVMVGNELTPEGSSFVWEGASLKREAVRVQYRAGYAKGALPAPVRSAILLMLGDLYRNRDTVAAVQASSIPMSTTVERLLEPLRRYA